MPKTQTLRRGEFPELLKAVRHLRPRTYRRDQLALALMHDSLLRVSSATGLKTIHCDWDRMMLELHEVKYRSRGDVLMVPATDRIADYAARYLAARTRDSEYLLASLTGKRVDNSYYRKLLAEAGDKGIGRHIHPHMLRAEGITLAVVDAGLPLSIVQQAAGHSSASTTAAYITNRPDWSDRFRQAMS